MAYVDTLITGIFFVGMWLMAKRKIENWIFWIVGNLLSIPLFFAKGYTFTSIQYIIFTIIAVFGFTEWKKILNNYNLK
jgi:nicotinamide mononucleotide transporter